MSTAVRPLYPVQKPVAPLPKKEAPVKRGSNGKPEFHIGENGRHKIVLNESEADSYTPNKSKPKHEPSGSRKGSKDSQDSRRKSVLSDPFANAKNLLFSLAPKTEEEEKKAEETKAKFETQMKNLEMDGFKSLGEASTWCARIFWFVILGVVLAILTFEIVATSIDYANNKVVTTYTVTRNESMRFPIVYICPGNFINKTMWKTHRRQFSTVNTFQMSLVNKSESNNKRPKREAVEQPQEGAANNVEEWRRKMLDLIPNDQQDIDYGSEDAEWPNELISDDEQIRFRRDVAPSNGTSNFTTSRPAINGTTPLPPLDMTPDAVYDFMLQAGLDANQVFLECKFHTDQGDVPINCSEIVTEVMDSNYAKCYKVSVGDRQQVFEARGLSLVIDTFKSRVNKDPAGLKRYNGMFLAILNAMSPASWEKIFVGGGTFLNLDISLEHMQLINVNRSDFKQPCVSSKDALLSVFDTPYSQTACQLDCFMKKILDVCQCVLMTDRSVIKKDIMEANQFCNSHQSTKCIMPKITNDDAASDQVEKCKQKCHVPCNSWRYKVNPTRMALNPLAFDNLPANITHDDILRLDVAYSRLEYTEFKQSFQTTLDTFIGNLGGQITLWVGGSMLTIINLPVVISKFLITRTFKKTRRTLLSRTKSVEQSVNVFQNIIQQQRSVN